MDEPDPDAALRRLIDASVAGDGRFPQLLAESPALASARFSKAAGATRAEPRRGFIEEIGRYLYSGDTALHVAAAAYRWDMADMLIEAGADVAAKNRRGVEPIHAAAVGSPGSPRWDPAAQAATIVHLIGAGSDPNARNMDGATPLHIAVRTRCAEAVRVLLDCGADARLRNKNGSTAMQLTAHTTGRSGSGSAQAKAQQEDILRLFRGLGAL